MLVNVTAVLLALSNDWVRLVCISGAVTILGFAMLSLGNAGCWRCLSEHVAMGRI